MSTDSDSSDDIEMEDLFSMPLTNVQIKDMKSANNSTSTDDEDENDELEREPEVFRPLISRRAKRRSILYGTPLPQLDRLQAMHQQALADARISSAPKPILRTLSRTSSEEMSYSMSPKVKFNWMRALKKVKSMEDPWEGYGIHKLPTERGTRHSYHPLKKKWITSEVEVKMENEPFNHGAMRSCFRLKKVSTYSRSKDWKNATNYVAKLYMEEVDRDVYFEDVKLQMDAKLWGEEYNRHNPPKKVDIFQMSVIEFYDRPGKPLYHLENFIEGNYIKYNSNSGFVDESSRFTPQAFSHFTFERSGHNMIVVDVQGVGDLWTDPQIHTAEGLGYGDGNLGTRGMALFFHSHTCNSICDSLGLSRFDMAPTEEKDQKVILKKSMAMPAATRVRGEEQICVSASPRERVDVMGFIMRSRSRTTSFASQSSDDHQPPSPRTPDILLDDMDLEEPMSPGSPEPPPIRNVQRRCRFQSESSDSSTTLTELFGGMSILKESKMPLSTSYDDDSSDTLNALEFPRKRKRKTSRTTEEERIRFQEAMNRAHRPSCFHAEMNLLNLSNTGTADSTLGLIHHEMAKYHELGRFALGENEIDMEAALFHEQQAAELGVMEARLTLARLYLGMQREVLHDYTVEETEDHTNTGLRYMEMAAEAGDRFAMIYMAQAYDTGLGLGTRRSRNHETAVNWYEKAVNIHTDTTGCFDSTMDSPVYELQAKVAELYLGGEYGLEKDASYSGEMYTSAAEGAMESMKGRLANKYFMLAEEAWGEMED